MKLIHLVTTEHYLRIARREAMLEVRWLHSVAKERGGSILNSNIVVDVDEQLQPYRPLRLRARICPGDIVTAGRSVAPAEKVGKEMVREQDLGVK